MHAQATATICFLANVRFAVRVDWDRLGKAAALACCLALLPCGAQAVDAAAAPAANTTSATSATSAGIDALVPARPRVALVLSGGGARGFAHVGVLRALKEMRVPIDAVAGVSMGAVVGGAYAAGVSVEQMEHFVRTTAWADIVADRLPRDDLAFRRREEDLLLPSRVEFGIGARGLSLPLSVAGSPYPSKMH